MIFLLAGCGSGEVDDEKNTDGPSGDVDIYTVIFYDSQMNILKEVEVAEGEDVIAPSDPSKDGYTFSQWSTSFEDVSIDLNIYPIFIPNQYSISFYSENSVVEVWNNLFVASTLDSLPVITRDGYIFDGWYVDAQLTVKFNGTVMPSNDLTLYAKWVADSSLATEELYYFSSTFGNTNGNLQNTGLAVYDSTRNIHLYSVGASVYAYDPVSDETELLFTSTYGGRATYLNMYDDNLYYIDSADGYFMRYDMISGTVEVLSDKEHHFLAREQSYIFVQTYEEYYGTYKYLLKRYSESSDSYLSSVVQSIEHINIDYGRIYYNEIDSVEFDLRASNFMGRTTVAYLSSDGFTEIDELVLQDVTQAYEEYIGLIASVGDDYGLYLYNTIDGVTEVELSTNIHNLNFDGTYFYYIQGTNLVKLNPETLDKTILLTVSSDTDFLNIVQHWIYYGDYDTGVISRLHPDTLEVEVLSE
jgi:uncharacterized repeat protein (TIGR02543 family)